MKLIREEIENAEVLTEEVNGKKFMYLTGIYLQSGIKNRNGRYYPEHIMDREVNRYLKEKVMAGAAWGELGHPNGPGLNADRISHLVTELKKDGLNYIGKARIVEGPPGLMAMKLIEAGGRIGMSSRGLGSLKEDKEKGYNVVQDDFRLMVAADIVLDPSAPDAFVNGIMEGVEYFYDAAKGTILEKKIEQIHSEMKELTIDQINEQKFERFKSFLNQLSEPLYEKENVPHVGLHKLLDRHGFLYHSSKDIGNHVHHTYVGGNDMRFNKMWSAAKREHKFRFANRNGNDVSWKTDDDRHLNWNHKHKILTFSHPHVKESVIFTTELTRLVLSERTGIPLKKINEAWAKSCSLKEDIVEAGLLMRRMIGLS